eukprot:TRINITY_DN1386_c0_g1_i3.p1 TRINITY_DN1386_c0_g1~~TRINITY_DN1386_c0_g1_i3.p1  ORF type:complete len:203 (+),score=20.68 TRINITY_DN1386_c0_g1_i3:652-1260(+)
MPFVALPTPGGARKKPSAPVQPLLLRKFVLADPVSAALLAYLMTFERSASAVHETPHHIFDKLGKPFCIVGHTDRLVAWLALAKLRNMAFFELRKLAVRIPMARCISATSATESTTVPVRSAIRESSMGTFIAAVTGAGCCCLRLAFFVFKVTVQLLPRPSKTEGSRRIGRSLLIAKAQTLLRGRIQLFANLIPRCTTQSNW